jgi:hypothetical protein
VAAVEAERRLQEPDRSRSTGVGAAVDAVGVLFGLVTAISFAIFLIVLGTTLACQLTAFNSGCSGRGRC